MSYWILPYKNGSNSVDLLKQKLGSRSIKIQGSQFQPKKGRLIINWGNNTVYPFTLKENTLNYPENVQKATNKISCFNALDDRVPIPLFTTDHEEAMDWLCDEGDTLVARHSVTGMGGAGIQLIEPGTRIAEQYANNSRKAPLYTVYMPKKHEYRVHYIDGVGMVKMQKKLRRLEVPNELVNWKIRNINNGFIFGVVNNDEEDMERVISLIDIAKVTIKTLGLDFGAVDILYNVKHNKYAVIEVNTAPGLCDDTAERYKVGFMEGEKRFRRRGHF